MNHRKKSKKGLLCFLLSVCTVMMPATLSKTKNAEDPDTMMKEIGLYASEAIPASVTAEEVAWETSGEPEEILTLPVISEEELQNLYLCPGGMPFGVRFQTEGVSIVGFSDVETPQGKVNPAASAGLRLHDVILGVNGENLKNAAQLTDTVENCKGTPLALHCRRGEEEFDLSLSPVYSAQEARYKTGVWVRDSGAGIGTVTFVLPESGTFAGLGHGICEAGTGGLVRMQSGSVANVTVSSVVKGVAGNPGELKGYFQPGKTGTLLGNTSCGVWGVFSDTPKNLTEALPVGLRTELAEGDASILCTLDGNTVKEYAVKISHINREATSSKCFTVTVTDEKLLDASGGIVQGMSGSPILQNGKIVGAVTHVLVNQPAVGYGIFIENMLASIPLKVGCK